ncbi:phenylalanine--tRNA ligase subunit beta [Sandaracinus amylolyticus]|uniref:phenylalanine--tRNA ligase subunit beta n=1 Tax=Sandaracinus amylolyticus TaxID=927083 RepID=UPI001F01EC35|nr:phenylalanine--tRNA ligase subunit beta [Sandaracinus amylolyticus]UJR79961.1 Phenylalanyl-tRNA synthetase subunit beta [Sandaracinus amylolyticus]
MKASYQWLRELSGVDASPSEMAERLTRAGVEVEGLTAFGEGLDRVVIAEVRGKRPHPSRDKLTLVRVWNGKEEREVVCGAPNVPDAGAKVLLAEVGARLPNGMEIAAREVAGVSSSGMLCSEVELGIGADAEGIVVLERASSGRVGAAVADALSLRDQVFEISLTPNRADCLGHVGLAREIAMLFEQPFVLRAPPAPQRLLSVDSADTRGPVVTVLDPSRQHPGETLSLVQPAQGAPINVPIAIRDADRCSRYLGLVLQHVQVRPAPFWMRYRLHVLGQRSIDAVVDVTNWVLLETGHPIHAFDLDALRGPAIVVRTARDGERFTTLDGIERELSTDDLVIADAEVPVALAGVMGGAASGVRATTRNVLLEVAHFDPRSVRRTSRRHGLHTEASHRFERGVDPNGLEHVLRRAAQLLGTVAEAASAPSASDAHARRIAPVAIALRPGHVESLLGGPVPASEVRRVLEGVGCEIAPAEEGGWRVTAPTHRPDLGRPEDLIEEVARVRGYDHIPSALASMAPSADAGDRRYAIVRALREGAAAAGLFEAVNFAFCSRRDLEMAKAPLDVVALSNPLSEERSVMRTSMLPGLLSDVVRAQRHQAPRATLFEVGRTYHPAASTPRRVVERPVLALTLSGPRELWVGDESPFDFWDGKGAVLAILRSVGLVAETVRDESIAEHAPWLHPRRSARVVVGARSVGVLGEVHPDVVEAFEATGRPIFGVLDLDAIVALVKAAGPPRARPLPRFPAVVRDLAVVVPEATTAADVVDAITQAAPLAERAELFDVYRGKPVPEGRKSLAFRIAYRDPDATLTDARVEQVHAAVVQAIADRFGGALRA